MNIGTLAAITRYACGACANCYTCHVKGRPEWDFICENTHGCDGIPITRAMSGALQRTDPRCAIVKALAGAAATAPKQ